MKRNLKCRKIMYLTNFYFYRTFFLIASCQILQNYAILIIPKQISCKQIAEFGDNLFILEHWKRLGCREYFPEKMIRDLLESHHFLKFGMKRYAQKTVSLNQRNISLIYSQRKNFFELKKVLLIQTNFFLM